MADFRYSGYPDTSHLRQLKELSKWNTLIKCSPNAAAGTTNYLYDILIYISNKMQGYTVYFIWKLLYMFRVVTITHHQERKQLYLQHLVFVTPLLQSAGIVEELEPV
jgi:hypothetical protein